MVSVNAQELRCRNRCLVICRGESARGDVSVKGLIPCPLAGFGVHSDSAYGLAAERMPFDIATGLLLGTDSGHFCSGMWKRRSNKKGSR